ncbi:MAG: hypothetical protein FJ116_01855 [Deltaproteobacteria bacterium]|nr:hypothetical protein [Deltaproteobacteria bacterium]MBM4316207.1 hypothetical protein [Deltaproteobacteria bacterium]
MFPILNKIDKALETKAKCTLIDKMGKYLHGKVTDSWIRFSGGKLRGKLVFESDERGALEMDANDILDIVISKE